MSDDVETSRLRSMAISTLERPVGIDAADRLEATSNRPTPAWRRAWSVLAILVPLAGLAVLVN